MKQLQGFHQALQKASKLEKTKREQAEKIKSMKKRQLELNQRVLKLLSRLAVANQNVGYQGFSKAEEEWFNELQGMKSLLGQVKRKKDKVSAFFRKYMMSDKLLTLGNPRCSNLWTRYLPRTSMRL